MAAWRREYTPGPFTPEEFEQFFTQGYVIKRNVVPLAEIQPAVDSVAALVDAIATKLFNAGKIQDLCADVPFEKRLIAIEKQFPNAAVLIHKLGILPEGVSQLWGGPSLLACARQILGEDLAGHPVWNLRTKTPTTAANNNQTTVPWHQDTAYNEASSVNTLQLTAWVPLVDANKENGCMEVIRYGHRAGKEVTHKCCVGGTWYVEIAEGELETIGAADPADIVLCEVRKGDVLFLNNVIPHRSLVNFSDHVRWSLDLRWQKPTEPAGFFGLKELIRMTKKDDPSFKPDWSSWRLDDRQLRQMDAILKDARIAAEIGKAIELDAPGATGMLVAGKAGAGSDDSDVAGNPFDTVIAGPWMGRWEIVHHNKHVDRFLESKDGGSEWHGMATGGGFG
jgi:hypothetical protein